MAKSQKLLQPPKGFRDFLPAQKRRRDWVIAKIKAVFERFGFEPLETPTLEYASLLLGKYGQEAEKLIYDGTISEGMIPKIKTCINALNSGVRGVVIIDGRKPHSILFELFSDKVPELL